MSQESDVWKNLCIRLQNPTSFSQNDSNMLAGLHTPVLASMTPKKAHSVPDFSITVQDHPIGTPLADKHLNNTFTYNLNNNTEDDDDDEEFTPKNIVISNTTSTTTPPSKTKKSKSSCQIL